MKISAIVVTNGVTTYLPETLQALAAQSRAPDQIAVFDWNVNGTDNSDAINKIWDAAPHLSYVRAPGANLGEVVRAGLATSGIGNPTAAAGDAAGAEDEWLWILHDDSPPEPDALAALLNEVELSPSVAIAGCKQVGLSGTPLLSVGYTTSRFGRRLTGIEDGEVDQGQHDHRDDVLAVGTAGMLIRADVWHELGGPDRALGPFMDGQDLSRRARLAGHRTVVVPSAVVRHDRASYSLRRPAADDHHSAGVSRRAAFFRRRQEFIHYQLVAAPLVLVPFLLVIALGAGLLRAIGRVVLKEPGMIAAEIRAPLAVLAAPRAVIRGRAQARRSKRLPRRVLRPLQATWREVYSLERDRRQHRAAARRATIIRDELDIAERAQRATHRRFWLTATLVVTAAITLLILGPLVTAGQLMGGALAPSQATLQELWQAATGQYIASGFGHDLPANPLLLVLVPPAALGSVFGLNLGAVITALLLLALPLAALTAWAAAGALTRSPAVRALAALAWVVAPALQFALGQGRLGAVLAHVFLPLVALGIIRGAGVAAADTEEQRRPEGSVAAAAGGALALAVVLGAAPALLPAALLIILVAAVFAGRKWLRVSLMIVPGLFVIGPLAIFARSDLALLATDQGIPATTAALGGEAGNSFAYLTVDSAPPAWQMLLGFPSPAPGVPWLGGSAGQVLPLALGAVFVLLAALGLLRSQRPGKIARFGWLTAALGLATAVLQGRTVWLDDQAAWPGSGVSLAWLGIIAGAVALSIDIRKELAGRSFGWRQISAATLTALAVIAPLATATNWAWQVRGGSTQLALTARSGNTVPAVVAQAQRSENQSRALLLEVTDHDQIDYRLLHRPISDLIDHSVAAAGVKLDGLDKSLAQRVGELTTFADAATVNVLAKYAIADILLLPPAPGEVDARSNLIAALDATPGLERVTANDYGVLWRVNSEAIPAAWARLESDAEPAVIPAAERRIETRVPAATESRTLVLAERASENWRAWLDDVPLRSVTRDDGLQAFELPTTGGELEVAHRPIQRMPWLAATIFVFTITVLLALPMRRRRGGLR